MDARELIKKYEIRYHNEEAIAITRKPKTNAEIEVIRAAKAEILGILKAEKKAQEDAAEARRQAMAGIEGLDAIRNAMYDERKYHRDFNRMMEDEGNDGINPPVQPKANSADLRKQYPRAAAYLKAESWTLASNSDKYAAGKKGLERIINGEDHNVVLAEMEAQWSKAAHAAAMNN